MLVLVVVAWITNEAIYRSISLYLSLSPDIIAHCRSGLIVTGVNLFRFVLPSQETHNLLCLSNLIIRLTLIISALLSRRGFGPR